MSIAAIVRPANALVFGESLAAKYEFLLWALLVLTPAFALQQKEENPPAQQNAGTGGLPLSQDLPNLYPIKLNLNLTWEGKGNAFSVPSHAQIAGKNSYPTDPRSLQHIKPMGKDRLFGEIVNGKLRYGFGNRYFMGGRIGAEVTPKSAMLSLRWASAD